MPPTGAQTKVQDPEYKNWLRVSLALDYLKVALHSFIQREVDAMHQSILQKLYGGSAVPTPQCSSCKSKDVKQNRNTYIWKFRSPCPSSLCDVWLTELMALHINPTFSNIYWENCDVTAWPFVPWECAKLYMPRGQSPANTGPAMSDSQAVLTLMASCSYFHRKLSQAGLTLTRTVSTVRNKVMHSKDMRLSDGDRKSFIQDIINLLEDQTYLGSLEDCKQAVAEIKTIDNDSVDVFFNVELQMIALKTAVNAVRQDLGMQEKRTSGTVDSMKEEYIQLTEKLRTELEAVENRVDRVENRKDTVENRVDTVENRQEQTDTALQKQEKKHQEMLRNIQQIDTKQQQHMELSQTMSASVATLGVRVEAFEENLVKLQEIRQRIDIIKLRDDLIKAYRNLRYVQVSPILDKERCDIDDIYVDLVIEEKQGSSNTEKESKYDSKRCKDVQVRKVTSYRQIFLRKTGSKFEHVFLRGKGGLGKTTFCRKVLHAWCSAHEGRAVAQDGYFEDEAVLQMFDLLFYLNLQEVSVEENLIEVICAQFPLEDIPSKDNLGTLLKDNGDKILFILDGLDEMTVKPRFLQHVVTRRVYPKCCFLVSSRPWKISNMELREGPEIDLLLDLKGFSKKNAIKCAEKIFQNCYKDGNAIIQFSNDIAHNKLATQLIHVPLLLLILAQVWYENERSLPSKFHELYILFLNLLADRMMEKYKKDPNHKQMRFTLGDTHSPLPSKISKTSLVVNIGEGLLLSLCEVAHHFLLSGDRENSLVFEEEKLLKDLEKEKLDVALDLGVLSVTDSVSYLYRKTSVSFLHKTVQEFFTALYFIFNPDKLANFIASIADLKDVEQNENIIIFLVGLMPKLSNRVLVKVNGLYSNEIMRDPEMFLYYFSSSNVSTLFLRCKDEVIGEDVLLNVSDLCVGGYDSYLYHQNATFKQSLMTCDRDYVLDLRGFTGLTNLMLHDLKCELYIPDSDSLSVLIMDRVTLSSSCCDVLGSTLTHCTKLKTLKIHKTDLHNCLLNLSNVTELEWLDMSEVTMSSSCCDVLGSTLTHCTKLKTLKIHKTDLHNCLLNLSNVTELGRLDMSEVTMSSSCDVLGSTLTHCTKLKTLKIHKTDLHNCLLNLSNVTELEWLDMSEVTMSSSCCDVLGSTLTHCTKLKTLQIHKTDLHNCLLNLSNVTELEWLDMSEVTMSSSCCDVLGSTLTHCTKLKTLQIHKTDLHNCLLNLSNVTELEWLDMSEVTMSSSCCDVLGSTLTHCTKLKTLKIHKTDLHNCLLNLSNVTELEWLDMSEVTMSSSCCDVLGSTLTHCTKLKTLKIHKTDLHNCLLNLSNVTELEWLDMSEVTMSSSCCDVLGSTLTHCTKLRTLKIHKTDLHNCLLNLSNVTELEWLDMSEVTMSSSCCDVLGSTLTHCTKLKTLKIHKTDLHNCLLNLSNVTELGCLYMSEVTMSSSCCDVLGSTLTHCTKLKTLKIHKTDLHNCLLNLSNVTELEWLDMSEVTMSSSCCDVLGSTLTHCTKMMILFVHKTDLHNCLLNLSNVTELGCLYMSEVTMSSSCCDVLGSTVTHCTKLKTLKIHKTDLHNCLLNLSNMTELRLLAMSEVTMSSSCDVLGSTLTHCTKLDELKIHKTDLHSCLLNLSNVTELRLLDMSEVTMSSSCCDVLGSTLTHCTKLKTLKIHKTDLHNCLLNLSNVTELRLLDMSEVTMSSSCCDVLGSTLTHCTKLKTLKIHKTDLHNCLLNLSNVTELRLLDMSEVTMSSSCCDVLGSTLTHCTKLKELKIHKTDLHNCLLNLSNVTELRLLDMSEVTMSSSCDVLGSTLTHCTKLKTLQIHKTDLHNCLLNLSNVTELEWLDMSEVTMSSSCCDVLGSTLTHCTKLKTLKIHKTDLHNCLLNLSNVTELEWLDMSEVTMSSSCCDVLGSTLTHCTKLKTLKIHKTDLHNCLLNLSNMTELRCLDMSEVTMSSSCDVLGSTLTHCTKLKTLKIHKTDLHNCLLNLSNVTELEWLDMSEVTMSSSCCDVLGSTLTHCTKLRTLKIHKTDLHNCLLNLSNVTELRLLDMSEVIMSSSCCDVLGSTLTHCTKLKTLQIHKTDLHNCLLNLSNVTELEWLDMSEVTMSSSCCDVLGSTLTHCTKLKTLQIHKTDLHNCLLNLSNVTELEWLDMSEVTMSSSCCDVLGSTLTHCTKLKTLKIHKTDLHNCLLNLSNVTELEWLDMSEVTMSSSCCDVLGSTLTHCTKLKTLKIHKTDLHNCLLNLSNVTELEWLDMSEVTMSSSCCDVLGSTLTHCTKLRTLKIHKTDLHNCLLNLSNVTELEWLDMSEVTMSSSCCDVLGSTLTHCTKLKTLKIHKTDLHNCLLNLSNVTELGCLYMSEVTMSSSCCDVLGSTVTHCTKLKTLKIHKTDLHNCLLNLSNVTELEWLDMSEVTMSSSCCDVLGSTLTHCTKMMILFVHKTDLHNCLLNLSNVTELGCLYMSEVTMSSSCCDVLGSTVTHCTKLKTLKIHKTDLHNCLLNLSNMTELRLLAMSEVTMSSSCDVLGSTLTHCTKLDELKIHKTDLHSCLLNLSNVTELRLLDMSEVTMSSSCCDVLGSTLTHCTKLKTLKIHKTDLHNCLLNLSNVTELRLLDMSEVTMSSSCCDVLGSTLTHCTKLKTLKIHKTDLHNCLLNLSNVTELRLLDMSEVTMSSSCCDVLGSTLTHCTKLKELKIHKTDLHNCLLNLSNVTELTLLDMSEVTMSSSCCDVLGSTLTHCTKLKELKIHKTDLHNCLLNLSNVTELRLLDMSEVTMSSSCDVLGSTLTHCTKLKTLQIHKTDLHNCLLNLSNVTELEWLDMSEVTMSSSCCDVLGSTLTHCTKLKTLKIHKTDLHNCLLNLSNVTELEWLDMSEVTMSSSCCDVLGSTLTHCTKLKTLKIHKTDLHNCLLNLSNMTELRCLDMSEVTMSSSCDVLGSTLTHCTKLKTLKIHKTDLHNCLLNLSNVTELEWLDMSEVTMSSSCCDVLGSTLTHCTKLRTLKIHKTDLHNCLLNLSNVTELRLLDMSEVIMSSSCCDVLGCTLTHCTKLDQLKIHKTDLHNSLLNLSNVTKLILLDLDEVTRSSSCLAER